MKTLTEKEPRTAQQPEATVITEKRYALCDTYKFRQTSLEKGWLALSIGLILAAFVPGAEFDNFKIPDVGEKMKSYFLVVGLILLGVYLLCFIAWFKVREEAKVMMNAQEADTPSGVFSVNHRVRLADVQKLIHNTSSMNLFSGHFHDQYAFKNMELTWVGIGPPGARGSLVFRIVENPLLNKNTTLVDYANELYETMTKTGLYRDRHVSVGSNMNIAVQWYTMTIPGSMGKSCDVHQLCKIVVLDEWLAYVFASYTDAASPEQKSILLETFEKFGS